MRASVFVGISVDGFLARPDGTFDFLPTEGVEDHGFDEFLASVDAIVMERYTFDSILPFTPWPYGKKPIIVLSTRPLPDVELPAAVERLSGTPEEIVAALSGRGMEHIYVDGGITIQRFLRAGLIQRFIITRVPVLIGTGRPLFGEIPRDMRLRHIATRQFESGLVQSEYEVISEQG